MNRKRKFQGTYIQKVHTRKSKMRSLILRHLKLWRFAVLVWGLALGILPSMTVWAETAELSDHLIYIDSPEDLQALAEACALDTWSQGKTVVLRENISLAETDFMPIPTFGGIFEGNGYTISMFDLEESVTPAGLFSYLQESGVVRNLHVSGNVIPSGDGKIAGGIVGENNGTISNCSYMGTVSSKENTGGIAGINTVSGIIENCQSSGAVFGENRTGGIVGYNMGTVRFCENDAYVNITSVDPSLKLDELNLDLMLSLASLTSLDTSTAAMDTGGIAGYSTGILKGCVNKSTIGYPHIGYNVGGIVGRSCGYIWNCENRADIYGRKDVGGVAGQMEPYMELNLTEDTLSKLRSQMNELDSMIDQTLDHASGGMGTVTARLNQIADYLDHAAAAASDIATTGSVSSIVSGSGESSTGGSVTVTPPQIEVEGSVTSSEGQIQGGLTESGIAGQGGSSASGNVSATTQITMNTSLQGLTSAVNGMSSQMRLLNSEISDTSETLTADMKAISNQINAISSTIFDTMLGEDEEDVLQDTSEENMDQVTLGKMESGKNTGTVSGDINTGGIVGSMAVEYELDPEDDVSANLSGNQRRRYELKAILQNCINTGDVLAKRSYAGGICGRMDLGLIIGNENYGDVESENGDYVGGIAGITSSTIRKSYAKCTLQGGSYIGGIVGTGVTDDTGKLCSNVINCYAWVSVLKSEQYIGAVSGAKEGSFGENYFISDDLAGINRLSYAGMAEPVTFEVLASEHVVPDAFKQLSIQFVAEGEVIKGVPFTYGESFDASVFPELPQKEGYYGYWDRTELNDLHYDTTVTAIYAQFVSALSSSQVRSSDRPVFFAEGQFDHTSELTAVQKPDESANFDLSGSNAGDLLKSCFTSTKINRELEEIWEVELPSDGQQTHTFRYLPEDSDPANLDLYIKQNGTWKKVKTEAAGSYLTFQTEGNQVQIAVVSTMAVWWVWLIAGVLILCFLFIAGSLMRKKRKRKEIKKAEVRRKEEEVS